MSDLLPGINHVDIHEGRLTGPFDLLRADMTQIRVGARVMLCVVADVVLPMGIAETKDGDIKAKWTIKPIDVALVRDEGMQTHLSNALHMIGVDADYEEDDEEFPTGRSQVGVYDEEGAFLGFEVEDADEEETEVTIDHGDHPDRDEAPEPEVVEPEKERLFQGRPIAKPDAPAGVEQVEVYGRPIEHKDKHLSSFLDERVPA